MNNFKNRAENDPLDEFVGIIYAKPIVKFGGSQVDQYSYVNLNISSSMIVDTYPLPHSLFSYYNKGTATYSDGHHRSRIYLNNNKYSFKNDIPVSFIPWKDNGIVHSGFLLSEFPETDTVSPDSNDKVRYEKYACQNIPVISHDNDTWGSFTSMIYPRGNHRFLSNRTLANKYPYFQNVVSSGNTLNGVAVTYSGSNIPVECRASNNSSPFNKYDKNAKCLCIEDSCYVVDDPTNTTIAPDIVKIVLDNDEIDCQKGDVITAALVTDMVTFNSCIVSDSDGFEETQSRSSHHIKIVELDSNGNINGTYDYEVPYNVDDSADMYDFRYTYPCTSACRHVINNKNTKKVRIEIDFYRSMIITDFEMSPSYSYLHAVLVEKNK